MNCDPVKDAYEVFSRYKKRIGYSDEASWDDVIMLSSVGAKRVAELFPIHHYYIHKDIFGEELLYVAHMDKVNSTEYRLVDDSKWRRSIPYAIRRDSETGALLNLIELSIFEGHLKKRSGGDISVWYHDAQNNAKETLAEYYSRRYEKACKQVARFEGILKQLQ